VVASALRKRVSAAAFLLAVAALATSCGSSSKPATPTVTAQPSANATQTPPATTQGSSGIPNNIATLTFIDPMHGWAISACPIPGEALFVCNILSTNDGGRTWHVQHQAGGRLQELQFLDAQHGFAIEAADSILVTNDGGNTWTQRYATAPHDLGGITFVTPQVGFAVASGVIFQLNDAGNAWVFNHGSPDCNFSSISFPTADEGWAGGSGPAGPCLFKTVDEGGTWEASFVGADSPSVKSAFFQSTIFRWLADPAERISQFNRDCFLSSMDSYSARDARLRVACDKMGMGVTLATADGGTSWQFTSEESDCLMGCQTYRYQTGAGGPVFYLDPMHVWQRTAHQEISWSTDGGQTWNKVQSPALCCDANSMFFVDANHGWITFSESIAVTTDGGRTWNRLPVTIQ
jgi:photosystem II stability/assembly factor-like uncharacterized protein